MDPCILLADRIEAILDRGLWINRDTCYFIDSTFGCDTIKALEALVCNEGDCERDVLMDLFFSPDEALQMGIEDLLADYDFQKSDETKISSLLAGRNLEPLFCFSQYDQSLKIKMPGFCADLLVARLKIWKKPDHQLSDAIGRFVTEDLQKQAMVKLRNSRFEQTRNRVDFLCRLIEKTAADSVEFLTCFGFMLVSFDELSSDRDIYAALRDKKKFYFRHLQKALKYEAELSSSNMEIMMLKGFQGPGLDLADTRLKMTTIDHICRICFGRSDYLQPIDDVFCCNNLITNDIQSLTDLFSS
jgi:hypothetical protein